MFVSIQCEQQMSTYSSKIIKKKIHYFTFFDYNLNTKIKILQRPD